MGADTFLTKARGKTARDAFREAVEDARHWSGHGGYTGTIAEKSDYVMITPNPARLQEHFKAELKEARAQLKAVKAQKEASAWRRESLEGGKAQDPEPTPDLHCSNCGSQNWTVWFHDVDARGISRVDIKNKVFYSPLEGEMIGGTKAEERNRLWCNDCNTNHELSEGWSQDFEEE